MAECNIQKALPSDASIIANLHKESWQEAYGDVSEFTPDAIEKWRGRLSKPETSVFLAYTDGRIGGFICGDSHSSEMEITDLFVNNTNRRKGIGGFLLTRILEETAPAFSLWVAESNMAAIALYEGYGFKSTGESKIESRASHGMKMKRMILQRFGV